MEIDLILNKDNDGNTHLFWNTKAQNIESGRKKDFSLLDEYKEKLEQLDQLEQKNGKSVDILNAKTEAFNKLQNEGSDILKNSTKETQSYDENLTSLKSSYDQAKTKATGFKGALNSIKGVAASVGTSLANMALTMGVAFAVQAAVSGITYLIQRKDELSKQAAESAAALAEENKSLDEYKDKITGLKEKLSDSSNTEAESYSIKKQLLGVQDELTAKYGAQLGAIDLVNGALKDEIGLIDKVIEKNNRNWKLKNQESVNDALAYLQKDLSHSNVLMPNGTYTALKFSAKDEASLRLAEEVASYARHQLGGEFKSSSVIFNVETMQELKSQMDELYGFIENYGEKNKIDVSDTLSGISESYKYWFDESYDKFKQSADQWADIEALENSAYSTIYNDALEAQKKYEEAIMSGDKSVQKQMVKSMSDLYDTFKSKEKDWRKKDEYGYVNDESATMADFFQNLFDEWNGKVVTLQFQMDYKGDKNDIKTKIEKDIKDWAGDKEVSDVDLQSLYDGLENNNKFKFGNSPDERLYVSLKNAASKYNLEVRELIALLADLDVVQSDVAEASEATYTFPALIDSEAESYKNLTSELDKIQAAYKTAQSVISDYNKTGILSIDNIQTLTSLGDEYLSVMMDENGNLQLNEDAYKKLANAKLNKIKIDVINNAIDNVSKLSDEAAAAAYLKTKTDELCESEKDAAKVTLANALASKIAQGGDTEKAARLIQQRTENMLNLIDTTSKSLDTNTDLTLGGSNAADAYTESLENNNKALEKQKSTLDEQKNSLEAVKNELTDVAQTYQEDYDNINNLIEQTVTLIKYEKDQLKEKKQSEIDGLKEANDAYQEQIDKMKEAIDLEHEEIKNKEELADKQRAISDIDKELSMLAGDNSAVSKNRRNELLSEKKDKQKDYNDTYGEQEREKRKAALDSVAEQHQKITDIQTESLQNQIENIDEYLSKEGELRRDAMRRIDTDSQRLYGQLLNYTLTYTSTSREEFDHMWGLAISSLEKYNASHASTFAIMAMLQNNIYGVNAKIAETEAKIKGVGSAIDGVAGAIDKNNKALSDYTEQLNNAAKAKRAFTNAGGENLDLDTYKAYINGVEYTTQAENEKDAAKNILDFFISSHTLPTDPQNKKKSIDYYKKIIEGSLNKYASGTRRSGQEVGITQDKGKELIFDQPSAGRYTPLNFAAIFNNKQTDNLWDISNDPVSFLREKIRLEESRSILNTSSVVNNAPSFSPNIEINIHGNATENGARALANEMKRTLLPELNKEVMKTLINTGRNRVR